MQGDDFNFVGDIYIRKDLKKIKKFVSLGEDIKNKLKIIHDDVLDSHVGSVSSFPYSDFIAKSIYKGEEVCFYKTRVPIKSAGLSARKGCRLLFGFVKSGLAFVPILVFRVDQEGKSYNINRKKFPLTSSGFSSIIREKLLSY
ncbi:hypothetical protein IID19_02845 [Patescibacteria group bacterium]|nr:hypothetical protein [Patescibacteria group bacterium]